MANSLKKHLGYRIQNMKSLKLILISLCLFSPLHAADTADEKKGSTKKRVDEKKGRAVTWIH